MLDIPTWYQSENDDSLGKDMKKLSEYCSYTEDQSHLVVSWYGAEIVLDHPHTPIDMSYIDKLIPPNSNEVSLNGVIAMTSEGLRYYTKRETCYYELSQPLASVSQPSLEDFDFTTDGSLIVVTSSRRLPHEAVAHGREYLSKVINDYIDLTDYNIGVIVSKDPKKSIYVGHTNLLRRMSEELVQTHKIILIGHGL